MYPKTDAKSALMKGVPYKAAIGRVLGLVAVTRVDIAYTVRTCARYPVNAGPLNWDAVLRIILYLKGPAGY